MELLNAAGQSTGQQVQRPQHIPEKGFAPRGRDNSPHEEGALNDMLVPPPQIPLKEGEEVC